MRLVDKIKKLREEEYKVNELPQKIREIMEIYLKRRLLRHRTAIIRVLSKTDASVIGTFTCFEELIIDETYVYSTMKFLMEEGFEVKRQDVEIYVTLPKEIL